MVTKLFNFTKLSLVFIAGLHFGHANAAQPLEQDLTEGQMSMSIINDEFIRTLNAIKISRSEQLAQPFTWQSTVANVVALSNLYLSINFAQDVEAMLTQRRSGGISPGTLNSRFSQGFNEEVGKDISAPPGNHYKMLNLGRLLNVDTLNPNDPISKPEEFAKLALDPFLDAIPPGANKPELALVGATSLINLAVMSVPMSSIVHIISVRTPKGDNAASYMAKFKEESQRRIIDKNNEWFSGLATMGEGALLKEIAHMKALDLQYEHEALSRAERIAAINAIALSVDSNSADMYDDLIAGVYDTTKKAVQSAQEVESKLDEEKRKAKEEEEQAEKDAKDAKSEKKKKKDSVDLDEGSTGSSGSTNF